MNYTIIGLASISLFILSGVGVRLFGRYALNQGKGLCDVPNARSAHQVTTPRGAGIVFVSLWLCSGLLGYMLEIGSAPYLLPLIGTISVISFLGYWDDNRNLSSKFRLVVQFSVAALFLYCLQIIRPIDWCFFENSVHHLGLLGLILGCVGLVWSTNLFNFMDGTDGLAGTESIVVLSVGGILFWIEKAFILSFLSFSMVFLVGGFLTWNLPKAKVFMGDVGSYCLGFLIAGLALIGMNWYKIPFMLWFILYGLFWFDATLTLLRRMVYRQAFFSAHCEHAYQRLYRAGFSHRQVLLYTTIVNSLLGGLCLYAALHPEQLKMACILAIIILTVCYIMVERIKPMVRQ